MTAIFVDCFARRPLPYAEMLSNTDLLRIEIATNWATDADGRLLHRRGDASRPAPHLVVASSGEAWMARFHRQLAEEIALEVDALVAAMPASPEHAFPPGSLASFEQIISEVVGPLHIESGPGFLIPSGTSFASDVQIIASEDALADRVALAAPEGANWPAEEWAQLIDGALGQWAMATADGAVVSICHTPRLTDVAAEAGTWTDPAFRGRGYAAAVTAAWASLLAPSRQHLFYSTSGANRSSQRVAERLRLRPIGWMWNFHAAPAV